MVIVDTSQEIQLFRSEQLRMVYIAAGIVALALQLHFLLDMTLLRDCLVCSSPKRPCDDRSRLY
jgi:hypothetical protein